MAGNYTIYYLAPDSNTPSWGLGIIYHHVLALNEAGFKAFIVHQKDGFEVDWLDVKVPTLYWQHLPNFSTSDILVVPEVLVNIKNLKKLKCRKILFVQASSFLWESLADEETHLTLGFESAIGIMPHMMPIIEQFTSLKAYMVAPFIAPYFYKNIDILHNREKLILIFPKFHQQDFGILKRVISDRLKAINNTGLKSLFKKQWKLEIMKGKTHKQTADLMKRSMFFIATNTFESFNASVVESMAAGCISVCYEGFGPRDYLKNNENAFVFQNNDAYKLAGHVFKMIDSYEQQQPLLETIRSNGYSLARHYNYKTTKEQLVNLYAQIS